jgi:predicted phosphodiesterase
VACWRLGSIDVVDKIRAIKPLRAVYGNIDGNDIRKIFPKVNIFESGGIKYY